MNTSILSSTFLLTLLLSVGLFFFIRASVKDRIEVIRLTSEQQAGLFLDQLQTYFTERAYQLSAVEPTQRKVTFEGFVRPSLLLAVFLTLLTAIGLLCLVLITAIVLPDRAELLLGILALSPIAGVFYWRGAGRSEKVVLTVEDAPSEDEGKCVVLVTAHRDELAELQRHLSLKAL